MHCLDMHKNYVLALVHALQSISYIACILQTASAPDFVSLKIALMLQVSADTPAKVQAFRKELEPLRQTLKQFKFLGGNQLNYSDIAVAGNFLVSHCSLS